MIETNRNPQRLILLFLLLIGLSACQSQPDAPAAAETAVPPTPISQNTTEEVAETETEPNDPAATSTPLPPPPTLSAPDTPTPIPPPTETPTPSASPTPVVITSAEDFGTNRSPFTGALVDDPAVLQRRPLAIKISNNPPSYTRPQAGISQADLVFEHITETNITRFTAIFHSQTPPDIGPVRSARMIDKELPAMYDASLFMSGSHPLISQLLFGSDIGGRIFREVASGFYRTDRTDIPSEHTLHADPVGLWEAVEERGVNRAPILTANMQFNTTPPVGGDPASYVQINYSTWSKIEWDYNEEDGLYYRTVDDEIFIDANTNEQVGVSNVILLYAPHQFNREICIYNDGDTCTLFTTEIQIWGSGIADIIRDGQKYDVTWRRTNRSDMFTFYDADGNVLPLQIGNTWFQVLPFYYEDPIIE